MKKWLILSATIALEVMATLSLRAAIDAPLWAILTVLGYVGAFTGLALLLRLGAPIGVVYGIWAAAGVALTAVFASLIFDEPFTFTIGAGIAIVIVGVVLVETGHGPEKSAPDGGPAASGPAASSAATPSTATEASS